MELRDIVLPAAVFSNLKAGSKKQALQKLSEKAATLAQLPERVVFDTLLQRERLGSTGVGNGIAIPHGKMVGIEKIFGVFARLDKPISFDALDNKPVDLIFLLLAPEGAGADHLKALAKIARLLRDKETVEKIRDCADKDALYSLLINPESMGGAEATDAA